MSQPQIQAGLAGGNAAGFVPPPAETNAGILYSFSCETEAKASQASFWIICALEEIKKLLTYAADYGRADPQARPNESGLRRSGDWPSRALFKRTLAELQSRLQKFQDTYFVFDETWKRSQTFKALESVEQRKIFFEYQDYLIAVAILALHGSRRQVAVHMSRQNVSYVRANGSAAEYLATLAVDFKEKVQSRRHNTMPLNEKYYFWFEIYDQAILPRIAEPSDSVVYWRRQTDGTVMSPSAFSRIHAKVWHDIGVFVQDGDATDVPTGFSPAQVRRWTVTEFFRKDDITEAELADYASIMNTSVEMMRKYYNRQMSEFRQLQVTRMIAQVLDAEQESEDEGL